jgi:hypothetical protein
MADCAVCGRYVDDNHWGVVFNNVRGPRHYLHDECRRLLIATRDQSDRFPCPHCSHDFTPDTFPFTYTSISGGVGDGGGAWKLEDQVCPHCRNTLFADTFKVCKFCGGGAYGLKAVRAVEYSTVFYYHQACDPASRRRIAAQLAPQPEKKAGWWSRLFS